MPNFTRNATIIRNMVLVVFTGITQNQTDGRRAGGVEPLGSKDKDLFLLETDKATKGTLRKHNKRHEER